DHMLFVLHVLLHTPATTALYTLSLHDALPILAPVPFSPCARRIACSRLPPPALAASSSSRVGRSSRNSSTTFRMPGVVRSFARQDRKSTRLNSSHDQISYAVFCLKKKK